MKNERNNCINSVNLNADSDFPYLVLDVVGDQSYPRNPGFQVMHWHEDCKRLIFRYDRKNPRLLFSSRSTLTIHIGLI